MSTRTALTVIGGVVGAYFGYPQLGLVIGGLIGGAVDPQQIQGPKIGEVNVQTSQEGAPRTIVYGAIACYGNIIQTGQVVKVETSESQGKGGGPEVTTETAYRTFAVRICEGPIAAVLRVWEDNKLVYDMRVGSGMIQESNKWAENKIFYLGDESQLPDPTLVASVNPDTPSYRGSAYMVANTENVTDRRGSIAQYRFEVAKSVSSSLGGSTVGPTNTNYVTDINIDEQGNMLMLRDQTGGTAAFGVGSPGTYTLATYLISDINTSIGSEVVNNGGDPVGGGGFDQRSGVIAIGDDPDDDFAIAGGALGSNNTATRLMRNGATVAYLVSEAGVPNWDTDDSGNGTPALLGGGTFFYETFVFMARNRTGTNKVYKWSKFGTGNSVYPLAYLVDPFGAGVPFMMHVSREGNVRLMKTDASAIREYDVDLLLTGTRTPPSLSGSTSQISAFAFDEEKQMQAYMHMPTSGQLAISVFDLDGNLIQSYALGSASPSVGPREGKLLFSDQNIFAKRESATYSIAAPRTYTPLTVLLSDIVSDIHERCGMQNYDVSELTDEVAGLGLAGDYTGASAIDTLRPVYFFDKSEHDKKLWYPKRGAAVIETLTIDDLTEVPDTTSREQAIEVPKKLHLRYQHAASGYAPVKATAAASSPDMLTTGEASLEIPVVLNEDQAAQAVDKMYKVTRSEIRGTTEVTVPLDIGAKYVAGNCVGLSLRGRVTRERIEQMEFDGLKMKLTLKPDRQSAYTSDLTGVPIPDPTLPPSTLVGETIMAVLDIPARIDSEDDLNYLVAVTGRLPPWYGARYQRSLDGGASYSTVQDITTASVMGVLLDDITAMSEHFTDYTNVINVELYRQNQSLESITPEQFLSEGNPFALENVDGSWEIMQFRDAVENSDGTFSLSVLHRGQLASGGSAHTAGARFVMLQRPSHIPAQSSWLGLDLTHRAITLGESADDTSNDETQTFTGKSQTEWAPAYLELSRDTADNILATWVGRGRFGNAFNPVMSVNLQGYRITFDDGSISSTFDTTLEQYNFDASAMGPSVTVSVSALNRITGAGPATTGTV